MTPEEEVIAAAIGWRNALGQTFANDPLTRAVDTLLAARDVVEQPEWFERTWVDVRAGDTVRPPGVPLAVALVLLIGPVVAWGVDDIQPLDAYQQRDIQYNPGRYAGSYATRRVTMQPHPIGDSPASTRDMKPDAPVEIELTPSEVRAIELLGGWRNRLDQQHNQA